MVTNLISSKSIIAKIIADLDMEEDDIRITDIREYIGEAIEKIGAIHQYGGKVSGTFGDEIIVLKDYQAKLPCDLHSLNQVAYSRRQDGGWLPMRLTTNSFNRWAPKCDDAKCGKCPDGFDTCARCGSCCGGRCYGEQELARLYMDMQKDFTNPHAAISEINSNSNLRQTLVSLITAGDTYGTNGDRKSLHYQINRGKHNTDYTYDLQYSIKPGYINSNMRDGFLKLSYTAIPRDDDGYPMVPDLVSVSEAIYWYVVMKLLYPKYYRNLVSPQVYQDAKHSWNFHRQLAYGQLQMPNTDGMKAIDNLWNKIYPERGDHDIFYSSTGDRQVTYRY